MKGSHICCPFHQDSTPSLWIDEEGDAYCFGCGWRGTIVQVMVAYGYTGKDLLLKQGEFLKKTGWRVSRRAGKGDGLTRPSDGWEKASADIPLDVPMVRNRWAYLLDRGYTMETLTQFNTYSWKGVCFGWPVDGDKWVCRWRLGNKKYLYDVGLSRASLFTPDDLCFNSTHAIVAEGVLDVMKLWQATYPWLDVYVGIFGTLGGPTLSQIQQLKGFERVYEMFDNDSGGDAHRRILEQHGIKAIRIRYKGGDPGDCSDSDLRNAIRQEVR